MDFIIVLPKSKGKSIIMVIVDRLTKYAHFCVLSHPFKASIVSTTFMETVQKLNGSPKILGNNFFLVWVLNCLIAHPIILNLMGKPR
jgi:hypothetical protein